jgi:hypothetical protein
MNEEKHRIIQISNVSLFCSPARRPLDRFPENLEALQILKIVHGEASELG